MEAIHHIPPALERALSGYTLYPEGHARREATLEALFDTVSSFLAGGKPIVLSLAADTVVINGTPLFEESAKAARFIDRLESRGTLSLQINPGVSLEDLNNFFKALSRPTSQGASMTLRAQLLSMEVKTIDVTDTTVKETFRSTADVELGFVSRISSYARRIIEETIASAVDEIATDGELDTGKLERATSDVAEMVHENPEEMIALTSRSYRDHFTYNHSVNACILTSALAERFVESRTDLNRIAHAALLHDIGKICVSEQILYKAGRLTDEEWDIMRCHPERGAEILLRSKDIDPLCVLVAQGHHMHTNGGGYPARSSDTRPHWVAELVGVVDVYEAMTARRPYKAPIAPDCAMSLIIDSIGIQFRPAIVRALLDVVGFYPPGSTLTLAGGEMARVLETRPGCPHLPRIAVYRTSDGQQLDSPDIVTLDVTESPPQMAVASCTQAGGEPTGASDEPADVDNAPRRF